MKNLEYISALVDDETGDAAASTDALLTDDEARGAWLRYHLIRDVMQNTHETALPADFADRIREEIAYEAPLTNVVPIQSASRAEPVARIGLWKPVAGLAVAASLIGGTFVGTALNERATPRPQTPSVVENPDPPRFTSETLLADSSLAPGTRWQLDSASADSSEMVARLNSLLTNHLEVASMGKVQGMMVHSRVVGYDANASDREK